MICRTENVQFERKIYEFPLVSPLEFLFSGGKSSFALYKYTESTGDYADPDKSTS